MFLSWITRKIQAIFSISNYSRFLDDLLEISYRKNANTIQRHRFVNFLTLANLFRFAMLAFWNITTGDDDCGQRIARYDYAFLGERVYTRYLLIASVALQSVYVEYKLMLCNSAAFTKWHYDLLFSEDYHGPGPVDQHQIRKVLFFVCKSQRLFYRFLAIYEIGNAYYTVMSNVPSCVVNRTWLETIAILAQAHIEGLFYTLAVWLMMPGLYYGAIFGIGQTYILQHLLKNVGKLVPKRRSISDFYVFRYHFMIGLRMFFVKNSYMGPAFTSLICFFSPVNAFLLMWIAMKYEQLNFSVKFFYTTILSIQIIFIFFVHYTLSKYIPLIAKPIKCLFSVAACGFKNEPHTSDDFEIIKNEPGTGTIKNINNNPTQTYHKISQSQYISKRQVRFEMNLNDMIVSFFTTNRYGATYGRYGLVTVNSFSKFLFVFVKIMMMAYKLQSRKKEKESGFD